MCDSLEAIQKRAIHITRNLTSVMPYSSMLYCVDLHSLASRREDLSRFFHNILDAVSRLQSLLPPPRSTARLLPQDLDLLKPFMKSILVPSATVHSYNMALIITSKPSCSTIVGLITS